MARVPASERTRNALKDMLAGKTAADKSSLVRQAARLIVEEALEKEAVDALGSGYYEHVADRRGYRKRLPDEQSEERRGRDRVRGAAARRHGAALSLEDP
jgi:transposase-like protein